MTFDLLRDLDLDLECLSLVRERLRLLLSDERDLERPLERLLDLELLLERDLRSLDLLRERERDLGLERIYFSGFVIIIMKYVPVLIRYKIQKYSFELQQRYIQQLTKIESINRNKTTWRFPLNRRFGASKKFLTEIPTSTIFTS